MHPDAPHLGNPEEPYLSAFRSLSPMRSLPEITVRFRKFANANSRIRLLGGHLLVEISDLLEGAPAQVHHALAHILISKLYRKQPDRGELAIYRRYLNRADMRKTLDLAKQQRGRKRYREPEGRRYNLVALFEELNLEHFGGLMARPRLGWSLRASRSTLGHYDPSHHIIVLSSVLDSVSAPDLAVRYVMFHEMLHLRYPTEYRSSRRCIHTPEFRAAERKFPGYKTAKAALRAFVEAASRT